MALFSSVSLCMLLLLSFFFFTCFSSKPNNQHVNDSFSLSFSLTSLPISKNINTKTNPQLSTFSSSSPSSLNVKSSFKYSTALVVTLPIGTPPQLQQMVLDTGSQLSWIQCNNKKTPQKEQPHKESFDPSLSSSFAALPCNHPVCKPRVPDFTIPTDCDEKRLCHYSYFYADGTFAEGNLVREKISFSSSQSTPPIILGCATQSDDAWGILGMNLGRLSFPSQAKITKFSYCVPTKQAQPASGSFYLGNNPSSSSFRYIDLLTFSQSQRKPNLDPLAYTLPLQGISIGGKKLNIPPSVFKPDASGSGQTLIDSGSELTYLVDEAYNVIHEELVKKVGPKIKKGYEYGGGVADICFDGNAIEIGRLIGDMVFEFEKGVEIVIPKERVLTEVGGGVHCLAIGRSERMGGGGNIIGNFHQQNLWVEFDIANHRVGFGEVADCSKTG
ncbi:aspartic proteinase PCS1 [Trifolium repens]|nr:aspartic proteinase PCS1 [Trifolium repens]